MSSYDLSALPMILTQWQQIQIAVTAYFASEHCSYHLLALCMIVALLICPTKLQDQNAATVYSHFPAYTIHWPSTGSMLVHCLRRWTNNKPTLAQCLLLDGFKVSYCPLALLFSIVLLTNEWVTAFWFLYFSIALLTCPNNPWLYLTVIS